MSLNQKKSTLQKPRKIRDQTIHVTKSEMTLNRVTKRQYSTVLVAHIHDLELWFICDPSDVTQNFLIYCYLPFGKLHQFNSIQYKYMILIKDDRLFESDCI